MGTDYTNRRVSIHRYPVSVYETWTWPFEKLSILDLAVAVGAPFCNRPADPGAPHRAPPPQCSACQRGIWAPGDVAHGRYRPRPRRRGLGCWLRGVPARKSAGQFLPTGFPLQIRPPRRRVFSRALVAALAEAPPPGWGGGEARPSYLAGSGPLEYFNDFLPPAFSISIPSRTLTYLPSGDPGHTSRADVLVPGGGVTRGQGPAGGTREKGAAVEVRRPGDGGGLPGGPA